MVVAGRVLPADDGDVAIMMVEAESTPRTLKLLADETSGAVAPTEETVAEGLEAAKPFIRVLCEAQQRLAAEVPRSAKTAEYPIFVDYAEDVYDAVAPRGLRRAGHDADDRRQARARDRDRPGQGARHRRSSPSSSRGARRRSAPRSAR